MWKTDMKPGLLLAIVFTAFLAGVIAVFAFMPQRLHPPGLTPSGVGPHILAFVSLTMPIVLVEPRLTKFVVLGAFAYGCCFELLQPFFGRAFEWIDLVLNATGIAIGVFLGLMGNRITRRLQ